MDMNNDYTFAGKGAKARQRQRLTLQSISKKIAKPKQRPYLANPTNEKRREKKVAMSESYHTAIGIKERIRLLVIDHDMSYLTMMDMFKGAVSGVTVGNIRRDTLETIKLLEREGLINTEALARRRKRLKKGE